MLVTLCYKYWSAKCQLKNVNLPLPQPAYLLQNVEHLLQPHLGVAVDVLKVPLVRIEEGNPTISFCVFSGQREKFLVTLSFLHRMTISMWICSTPIPFQTDFKTEAQE